jgi:hypothetical protein
MIDAFKNTTHHLYRKTIDTIAPFDTKENRETVEKVTLIAGAIVIAGIYRYFSPSDIDSKKIEESFYSDGSSPLPKKDLDDEPEFIAKPSDKLAQVIGSRTTNRDNSVPISSSPSPRKFDPTQTLFHNPSDDANTENGTNTNFSTARHEDKREPEPSGKNASSSNSTGEHAIQDSATTTENIDSTSQINDHKKVENSAEEHTPGTSGSNNPPLVPSAEDDQQKT